MITWKICAYSDYCYTRLTKHTFHSLLQYTCVWRTWLSVWLTGATARMGPGHRVHCAGVVCHVTWWSCDLVVRTGVLVIMQVDWSYHV